MTMTKKHFLLLIRKYGYECVAAGQGYTATDADELYEKIKVQVDAHWREEEEV